MTINYKKSFLACYLWYQYLQLAGRFILSLVVLAYYLNDNSSYIKYNNNNILTQLLEKNNCNRL